MKITLKKDALDRLKGRLKEQKSVKEKLAKIAGQPEQMKAEAETLRQAAAEMKRQLQSKPGEITAQVLGNEDLSPEAIDSLTETISAEIDSLNTRITHNETKAEALLHIASEMRDTQSQLRGNLTTLEALIQSDKHELISEAATQYLQQVKLTDDLAAGLWAAARAFNVRIESKLAEIGVDAKNIDDQLATAKERILNLAGILELLDDAAA